MKVSLLEFDIHGDERGSLIALESNENFPFAVRRVYFLYDTKSEVRRGYHAHRKTLQLAVAVSGSCKIVLNDGRETAEVMLYRPEQGLLIEPGVWHEMFEFSEDCVLMVLADDLYDERDYIRDYSEFLKVVGA